jgi:putative tryptophan/tyrosine transport system substrate-binding protein
MAIPTRRREFILALGGAAVAWPLSARAQQARKTHTIGLLSPAIPPTPVLNNSGVGGPFSNGLRELGWIEGQNITIERRYAENRLERLPELASELVRLNVELIVALGTLGPLAAKRATSTIPDCYDSRWRSSGERPCCQSGSPWRQRHRAEPHGAGHRRQAT